MTRVGAGMKKEGQAGECADKPIIGWREWVAFPDLDVPRVKAKIDTGARSSAMHASGISEFNRDGVLWVNFHIHPFQRKKHVRVSCSARVFDHREVKSSSGHRQERYVIITRLEIMGQCYPIEITLTDRDSMGFRVLLGRTAFRNHFLIDPNHSFLCGKK
uniref:Uncharacterized conserved protein n=1 Tax=Candidatus Kentrum sp. DK TaxID=2126562 RepID=A0A450SUC2_9GAMM|nr:MAG: Uncharacterized conserved protein [Candidatus Kentron sp. DK]VFJ58232.1 MAG: Uncharacterized conserved protein [Candidatus Kentron sp. DK]